MAVCDGYPGVGLLGVPLPPPPPFPLVLLLCAPSPWLHSSRLTPGFHRGARLRPRRLMNAELLLVTFAKDVTDQAIKSRQVGLHVPASPLRCVAQAWRCTATSHTYATDVHSALGELFVAEPKLQSKTLLETTHATQQQQQKKPPH
ncbi:unnamed protein product [Pleuronectes platessa]|uniref:Uncharacterized protein n=1 Tax=Pleuronectes platessa TaxID=8262 RepID=A0A9N7TS15_PLEPL|nr:unnamed protein product [Pleuronectes platessa]